MPIKAAKFPNARILVVDDSDFDRLLISTALKKAGFTSLSMAVDGQDALQKTLDLRPDLVLLDLSMPNLDGFGYCEKIRSDSTMPKIPILVQTALEDRKSRLAALSCGADDFLTKPLDMDELVLRITVHTERYMMLRDMQNMCDYLKLELDAVHGFRADVGASNLPTQRLHHFENHCEVMDQLALLSADAL